MKLCPYPDHRHKRFCLTVSPYLTLSFSPLINIDGAARQLRRPEPVAGPLTVTLLPP